MDVFVNVTNQKLKIATNLKNFVSGTQKFIRFAFNLSDDWDGLKSFAQFRQDGVAYNDYLDENNCVYLPPEIGTGTCTLMLYGSGGDNTIATTNYLTLTIDENIFVSDATSTNISTSLYDQLVTKVNALEVWNEQHLSELEAVDKNLQIQINSKADNAKLAAEIARAITAESENAASIAQKANQSDVDELALKVAQLEQNEFIAEMIDDAVSAEMARYLESGALANMTIEDGSVSRSKVDADLAATLEKVDTAMQPNVYDTQNLQSDVYLYAQAKADTVQANLDAVKDEIRDAYALTDTVVYTNLGDAVRGAVDMANNYSQALLADYRPFSIKFVDELPNVGDPMVFYLVPNKVGTGYHKYWWITDASGVSQWDEFGNSSTIVVAELPETGDTNTDYIVQSGAGYLYYKWIDGYWETVAGCTSSVVSALPDVGNEYTDYYLLNADGYYTHYRWINGKYHAISSENGGSGTKEAFIVRLTESEDGQGLIADKSSINAIAAYKAGVAVYCELATSDLHYVLPVLQYWDGTNTIMYGHVSLDASVHYIIHYADGSAVVQADPLVDEKQLQDVLSPITQRLDALEQNSSSSVVQIDATLTVSGAAADAKTVGEKLDFFRKYTGWIDTQTGVYIDTVAKTLTFGPNTYITYGNTLLGVSNTTHDISEMINGAWVYLDYSEMPYKLTKDRNTKYVVLLGALWKPNHLADFHMDKTKLFIDGMPVSYTGENHGKTINCLGDSMTEGVGTTKAYHQWFGQLCGFQTINAYGLGGSCIAPKVDEIPTWEDGIESFYERYDDMADADVVTVFGCVNDWTTGRELGTISDTTTDTFYGAMKALCEGLIAKYPSGNIYVFSSPQCDYINRPANNLAGTKWEGNTEGYNRKGYKLQDYANAMAEVCAIYGVPFCSLTNNLFYGLSGVLGDHNGTDGVFGSDALHPNAAGHEKIAIKMANFINGGSGNAYIPEPEVMRVNFMNLGSSYLADKSYSEVAQAYSEGKSIHCIIEVGGSTYILPLCNYNQEQTYFVYGGASMNLTIAVVQNADGYIGVINQTLATPDDIENAIANLPTGTPQQMELIASGTNTEPVRRFKITTDNDGNAFELIKAKVYFKNLVFDAEASVATNKNCYMDIGNASITPGAALGTGDFRDVIAYADNEGTAWLAQGKGDRNHSYGETKTAISYAPNQTITKVDFGASDASVCMAAGATYELWGVRK